MYAYENLEIKIITIISTKKQNILFVKNVKHFPESFNVKRLRGNQRIRSWIKILNFKMLHDKVSLQYSSKSIGHFIHFLLM